VRSKRRSRGGAVVIGGLMEKVSEWDGRDGDWKVAEVRRGRLEVGDGMEEGVEDDIYKSVNTKSKIIERA
jgi:hypothetical protein